MCFSREHKFCCINSPIDRAIIGFWGFGSSRRFSTMLRIGFWVFRAVFDEVTCHLSRAPGGVMLTPIWQPLGFFCPQIMKMKYTTVERSQLWMKCEQAILVHVFTAAFIYTFVVGRSIGLIGRRNGQTNRLQPPICRLINTPSIASKRKAHLLH